MERRPLARRRHVPLTVHAEIRRATAADAAAIARIQVHGHEWAYRDLLPPHPLPTDERIAERTRAWPSQLAADSSRRSFVAERDGAAIGFVTCGPAADPTLADCGEVFALYLEPAVVGSGVGRALFEHAVADLQARGFDIAVLWVLESNERARRFYERAGWTPDGAHKDTERNGHVRCEIRYQTRLRQ